VRVDFYQLGAAQPDSVIAAIAGRLLGEGQRLLVVASDEALLARLDRQLWDQGAASFLPHGLAGGSDDAAQPILLSTGSDAPNLARNVLIADGEWRESALAYDRAFYLFDEATLEGARLAWKLLAGRDGVERNYWALEDGKWVKKA
jgi:DNA polymerase-3 subunit chi